MKYDPTYIARLILKQINREQMTFIEQRDLDQWLDAHEGNRELMEDVQDPKKLAKIWEDLEGFDEERAWKEMVEMEPELFSLDYNEEPPKRRRIVSPARWWRNLSVRRRQMILNTFLSLVTAAALLPFLIRLFPSLQNGSPAVVDQPRTQAVREARPQLAGGPVVELAEMVQGTSETFGSTVVIKKDTDLVVLRSLERGDMPGGNGQPALILRNPRGRVFNALLTDNTAVKLNSGSQLQIAYKSHGAREVTLTGEGYFKTAALHGDNDLAGSFTVNVRPNLRRTNGDNFPGGNGDRDTMKIVCMGTQFNVKAYPEDKYILTTLEQGMVRLEFRGQVLTLRHGQSAVLDSSGNLRIDQHPVTGSSWKDGSLEFSNEPVDVTLGELARIYNMQLYFKSGWRPTRLYGTLRGRRSDPLKIMLEELSRLGDFAYKIQGDTIVVSH